MGGAPVPALSAEPVTLSGQGSREGFGEKGKTDPRGMAHVHREARDGSLVCDSQTLDRSPLAAGRRMNEATVLHS